MKKFLFLDDIRQPQQATVATLSGRIPLSKYSGISDFVWDVVENYQQFVEWVNKNGPPDVVTFDFDLDESHYSGDYTGKENGLDCVDYLIQKCMDLNCEFPKWFIHSFNPIGSERMRHRIEGFIRNREV